MNYKSNYEWYLEEKNRADALAARLAAALRVVEDDDQWIDCGARIALRAVLTGSAPACNHFPGQTECEWCGVTK